MLVLKAVDSVCRLEHCSSRDALDDSFLDSARLALGQFVFDFLDFDDGFLGEGANEKLKERMNRVSYLGQVITEQGDRF